MKTQVMLVGSVNYYLSQTLNECPALSTIEEGGETYYAVEDLRNWLGDEEVDAMSEEVLIFNLFLNND